MHACCCLADPQGCRQVIVLEKQIKTLSSKDPQSYAKKKKLQTEKAALIRQKRQLAAMQDRNTNTAGTAAAAE